MSQKFGVGSTGQFWSLLSHPCKINSYSGSNGAPWPGVVSLTCVAGAPLFSSLLPFRQAGLGFFTQSPRAAATAKGKQTQVQALFKPLRTLVMSCWSKQVSWPSPDSKGGEINSTSGWKERQSHIAKKALVGE